MNWAPSWSLAGAWPRGLIGQSADHLGSPSREAVYIEGRSDLPGAIEHGVETDSFGLRQGLFDSSTIVPHRENDGPVLFDSNYSGPIGADELFP